VLNGEKLRTAGKLDEALANTTRPSPSILFHFRGAGDPPHTGHDRARETAPGARRRARDASRDRTDSRPDRHKESEQRESAMLAPPELRPAPPSRSTSRSRNQSMKTLYDTVGTMAAVNVLFDPELMSDNKKFSLDLRTARSRRPWITSPC